MTVRLDTLNFPMCSGCHQPELRPGTSDQGAVDTRHHMEPPLIRCLVLTIICEACSVMVQLLMFMLLWSVKRRRVKRSLVT